MNKQQKIILLKLSVYEYTISANILILAEIVKNYNNPMC